MSSAPGAPLSHFTSPRDLASRGAGGAMRWTADGLRRVAQNWSLPG